MLHELRLPQNGQHNEKGFYKLFLVCELTTAGYVPLSSLRRKNAFQTKKRIKGKGDIGIEGKEEKPAW